MAGRSEGLLSGEGPLTSEIDPVAASAFFAGIAAKDCAAGSGEHSGRAALLLSTAMHLRGLPRGQLNLSHLPSHDSHQLGHADSSSRSPRSEIRINGRAKTLLGKSEGLHVTPISWVEGIFYQCCDEVLSGPEATRTFKQLEPLLLKRFLTIFPDDIDYFDGAGRQKSITKAQLAASIQSLLAKSKSGAQRINDLCTIVFKLHARQKLEITFPKEGSPAPDPREGLLVKGAKDALIKKNAELDHSPPLKATTHVAEFFPQFYASFDYRPLDPEQAETYACRIYAVATKEQIPAGYRSAEFSHLTAVAERKKAAYNLTASFRYVGEPIDRLMNLAQRHLGILFALCPNIQTYLGETLTTRFTQQLSEDFHLSAAETERLHKVLSETVTQYQTPVVATAVDPTQQAAVAKLKDLDKDEADAISVLSTLREEAPRRTEARTDLVAARNHCLRLETMLAKHATPEVKAELRAMRESLGLSASAAASEHEWRTRIPKRKRELSPDNTRRVEVSEQRPNASMFSKALHVHSVKTGQQKPPAKRKGIEAKGRRPTFS